MQHEAKVKRPQKEGQGTRRGTAAALLDAAKQCSRIVQPGDVEELERLIEEGAKCRAQPTGRSPCF